MPAKYVPYVFDRETLEESRGRAAELIAGIESRRSCRFFSGDPVPRDVIESVIRIAHSAPSGANRKPWRFVAINDPILKHEIRLAAEAEERESYDHRMPKEWLEALEPLGTDADKPFLEIAPWLVVIFRIDWEEIDGRRVSNYYPAESTGIASGFFLMAAHRIGLATLTHTPSPMGFLRKILNRPDNEKPYLLVPIGYPAADCPVPDIPKKPLVQSLQWNRGVTA